MSEQLRVEISGDSKDLQQATKKATKDLKDFKKVADSSVGGIAKPAGKSAKGIKSLGAATANANPTLQEFSRVIQDAPFGIQGVGNNITQLVSNFGNLSKSAGGAKNAFKAIASSFLGPGGILFAVSIVVSALTVFGDTLFKTKTDAEKLAEATNKASEELKSYVDSLNDANKAQLKGVQSAQSEIIQLNQLRKVAEDVTRSNKDRSRAVQELQRLFPDYFKGLSNEKILNGSLSGVYNQLTTAILKRAKATAATNLLTKNAEKEITLQQQLLDVQNKLTESNEKALRLEERAIKLISTNQRGAESATAKANSEREKANDLIQKQISLAEQIGKAQTSSLALTTTLEENGGIDLSGVELKSSGNPKVKISPNFIITDDALQTLENSGDLAAQNLQKGVDKASEKINLDFAEEQLKRGLNRLGNLKIGEKTELELSLERLNTRIRGTIADGLSNSLAGLGQSLGEALAQGGDVISAVGNGLLSSLGGFLSRMGQLLIEYGTLAVLKGKLDLAIVAGGPVAIGAGLAAIAVGIALSAAGAALSSAATGGASGGGGSVSGGGSSNNRSFTSSSGGGFGDGTVVFEIAGTKLVGVLNRTLDRNSSLGGGNLSLG